MQSEMTSANLEQLHSVNMAKLHYMYIIA